MLRKLSSGKGLPSKKRIFGHVTSLIGENVSSQHIQKNFPGFLQKLKRICLMAAKLLKKRKCGSSESGGVASPMYKQESLAGHLITEMHNA